MTATQVFLTFLRETCTLQEYLFFGRIISSDCGNRYFRKRPLFKKDFVEGYLSRNNRYLANFMTRLFILAPNLIKKRHGNPRWDWIVKQHTRSRIEQMRWSNFRGKGVYLNYYRNNWYSWLCHRIHWDETEKRMHSPFKKGEEYDFKLLKKGDKRYKPYFIRTTWARL
jgi:hypothetical protein